MHFVFQDVCGAADSREQPVDAGGAGRLRLLQTVPAHHHGAQGGQIYPLIELSVWMRRMPCFKRNRNLYELHTFFHSISIDFDVAATHNSAALRTINQLLTSILYNYVHYSEVLQRLVEKSP